MGRPAFLLAERILARSSSGKEGQLRNVAGRGGDSKFVLIGSDADKIGPDFSLAREKAGRMEGGGTKRARGRLVGASRGGNRATGGRTNESCCMARGTTTREMKINGNHFFSGRLRALNLPRDLGRSNLYQHQWKFPRMWKKACGPARFRDDCVGRGEFLIWGRMAYLL